MTRHLTLILLLSALLYGPGNSAFAGITVQTFSPGSYQQILDRHMGNQMLMVLWSLDCPPCQEEFPLLKEIQQRHPQISVVLVLVDGKEATGEIIKLLEFHKMEQIEHWVFTSNNSQKLRHEVDPRWYGELPRLYLFDKQQRRKAKSGRTTRTELESWLQALE